MVLLSSLLSVLSVLQQKTRYYARYVSEKVSKVTNENNIYNNHGKRNLIEEKFDGKWNFIENRFYGKRNIKKDRFDGKWNYKITDLMGNGI